MKQLRDYQVEITDAQNEWYDDVTAMRASVYSPTGSGKTEMFLNLIKRIMLAVDKPRILVVHPRLALSADQQERFKKSFDVPVEFTCVHSGKVEEVEGSKRVHKSVNNATALEEIRETTAHTHFTFTSYNSLNKIAHLNYDLIICDEAHYLVQREFGKNLTKFNSKVIFYTATPAVMTKQDYSMEDKELFGNVIASILPKDLILNGYIVAPRLRLFEIETVEKDGEEWFINPSNTIAHVFVDQRKQVNPKLAHKMLVAMPNTLMFSEIMDNISDMRAIAGNDVDVYYVTAGEHVKNSQPAKSRKDLLDDFAKNKNESIILHCDTLAEGIDIDGLVGTFMFRELSKMKFGQTLGRCSRPYKKDLDKLGEIKNTNKRLKPNSIVTVPIVNGQPYFSKVADFMEIFTMLGYEDITSYLDAEFKPSTGGEEEQENDNECFYSNILSVKVNEEALDINKLFNEVFGEI